MPDKKLTDVTDNNVGKMTDNEIKKALECKKEDIICAVVDETDRTYFVYNKDALDLINRLQDKNKAYKYYYDECLKDLKKANTENERLKYCNETNISSIATLHERLKTAKAEAYKECIEKVKEELKNIAKIDWQGGYYYLVGEAFFDNLLKELVGE